MSALDRVKRSLQDDIPAYYLDDDDDEDDGPPAMIGGFDPTPNGPKDKGREARKTRNRSVLYWGSTLQSLTDLNASSSQAHKDPPKPSNPPPDFNSFSLQSILGEPSYSMNISNNATESDDDGPPSLARSNGKLPPRDVPSEDEDEDWLMDTTEDTVPLQFPSSQSTAKSSSITESTRNSRRPPQPNPLLSIFRRNTNTIPGGFPTGGSGSENGRPDANARSKAPPSDMARRLSELASQRRKEAQQQAMNQQSSRTSSSTNGRKDASASQSSHRSEPVTDLALKQDFEHALEELEEARDQRDRLSDEKAQLENQLKLLKRQIDDFSFVIDKHEADKLALKKQVKKLTDIVKTEYEEPMTLKDRLDQAHYKLRKAERRNRYVDDTDRWKADAKYRKKKKDTGALLFGFPSYEADEHKEDVIKERRGAQGLIAKSVTEVVSMMSLFNHSVFQSAASLTKHVVMKGVNHATVSSAAAERARKVLGSRAVYNVVVKLPELDDLNPLLAQIILQIFLVFWCNQIIEAWYPKQPTFAEFLVDICSNIKVGSNANQCGKKTMITQTHTRDSLNLFGEWAQEIIDDLHEILGVFGWVIEGYNTNILGRRGPQDMHNVLVALIKEAYDLRTAMAEISTSGDVDLAIISFDTPFNSTFMENEFEDQRTVNQKAALAKLAGGDSDDDEADGTNFVERVVGTTGIGLQREVMKPHAAGLMKRDIEMVLKPKVVLEQSLTEAFEM